jgi:cytochrome o ubiquinol oxidase subunit 2
MTMPVDLRRHLSRLVRFSAIGSVPFLLGGCDMVVLHPAGDVAQQQGDLVLISTALMLLIILPVMALTALFAWRYRSTNQDARYDPDWDHSTGLELVIWAAPLLIIICLGALTWVGTHLLDPYRPLARTAPGKAVEQAAEPLEVDVVALDWKWLFIYPEYGIATVNELAAPVDRPIRFRISSSSVMNSFYVPALAGQIYAMPGMETKLHAVVNKPGDYQGFSANYSGAGFSHMRFRFHGLADADFAKWVAQARVSGKMLDRPAYLELERPSENVPATRYANVAPGLFDAIVNMCVEPGKMCMGDMMKIDARGGLGMAGVWNVKHLAYDKYAGRGTGLIPHKGYVLSACAVPAKLPERADGAPVNLAPLLGAGLARPEAARPPMLSASAQAPAAPRPLS